MRARAALAAVMALSPALAVAAVAGVALQRDELTRATALVAEEQARIVAEDVPEARGSTPEPGATLGGEESLVQVVSRDGRVVDASPALRTAPALLSAPADGQIRRAELDDVIDGEDDTYLAVALPADASGRYVVAARSLESVDAAVASTTRLLALGVPSMVASMAALSWVLAGRALRPVESLRARASEITATGAGTRLPDVDTGDEIERLTTTLNEMLDRLDQSSRSQRQFVADASHELRSPVAAIRAVMEVASTTGRPDWAEVTTDVLLETTRLERLLTGLLALARRDSPTGRVELVDVDLAELVSGELRRPRRLPVRTTMTEGAVVRGDRSALASIVRNLLENADRHGRRAIAVDLALTDDWAELTVTDDGNGIPPHEAERVFDRFVRLDEARDRDTGGTGLGLAIARAITSEHGGTLTVDVQHTPGARLRLRLPLAMRAGEARASR